MIVELDHRDSQAQVRLHYHEDKPAHEFCKPKDEGISVAQRGLGSKRHEAKEFVVRGDGSFGETHLKTGKKNPVNQLIARMNTASISLRTWSSGLGLTWLSSFKVCIKR